MVKKRKIENPSQQYENSVALIESNFIGQPRLWGTGSVIDQEKGWILTCAHISDPSSVTTVCLGSDSITYSAKVVACNQNCDLTILQVDNPTFRHCTQQISMGEHQPVNTKGTIVGFSDDKKPITTNACIQGYGLRPYLSGESTHFAGVVNSRVHLAQGGGPMFDADGYQIGVLFQVMPHSIVEPTAYIIPVPVIKPFLAQAMRDHEAKQNGSSSLVSRQFVGKQQSQKQVPLTEPEKNLYKIQSSVSHPVFE